MDIEHEALPAVAAGIPAGTRHARTGPDATAIDAPGLILLDAERTVRGWNPACATLLGLRPTPSCDPSSATLSLSALLAGSHLAAGQQDRLLTLAEAAILYADRGSSVALDELVAHAFALAPGLWALNLLPAAPPTRLDGLTGLADRAIFLDRVREATSGRGARAVLTLDLDRFKAVNDTLGHPTGDALLRTVADRLRGALRPGDVAARLGGDEFAVLQEGGARAAETLASRLVDLISRPYLLGGQLIVVGASVGIALLPDDAADTETLMRRADLALYAAKAAGRGTWRRFAPEQQARAEARRALENDLRRALPLRQFEIHYQPQHDAGSGRLAGFEALLRWRHPTRGLVSPGDFVPLAEESGLIAGIGEWVLREACAEAAAWPSSISIAVNVAPRQIVGGGLERAVAAALAASGLAPSRLEIEITESALLGNADDTVGALRAVQAMGVQVSMDDFGTGYSSLTQLRSFPFDRIKIDRSFVSGDASRGRGSETGDGAGAAIVRAVAALGAELGMRTTAEGVETAEQLERVRAMGCTDVQGYLLGRPLPREAARQLVLCGPGEPPAAPAVNAGGNA